MTEHVMPISAEEMERLILDPNTPADTVLDTPEGKTTVGEMRAALDAPEEIELSADTRVEYQAPVAVGLPAAALDLTLPAVDLFGDRVMIRPLPMSSQTGGGIVTSAGDDNEPPLEGLVIAVGPGRRYANGVLISMTVEVGDLVLYPKFGGVDTKLDDEPIKVMREDEIVGRRQHSPYKADIIRKPISAGLVLPPDGVDLETAVEELKLRK